METGIGVFSSRDRAEEAVRALRHSGVPEESIIFLTRSETEAKAVAKEFGASVGGFMGGAAGMTAGVIAATLLLPGIGTVFALGFGAAALLGAAGAGAGTAMASAAASSDMQPSSDQKSAEDIAFFREVLKEGRSLVVVRTESQADAAAACAILDQLGLSMEGRQTPGRMQTSARQVGDTIVLTVSGRITLGEGNVMLREIVGELADKGHKRIVLNLADVNYMDSSGLGELVKAHTTVRNKGGELKLASVNKRVNDLLQLTHLSAVFDIHNDEASALGEQAVA
ncbi:MAG: STAS domain-containing protein [Candidatus Sulfotelmatobacter sp.]